MLFHGQKLCTDLLACAISRVNQRLITFHFFFRFGWFQAQPSQESHPSIFSISKRRTSVCSERVLLLPAGREWDGVAAFECWRLDVIGSSATPECNEVSYQMWCHLREQVSTVAVCRYERECRVLIVACKPVNARRLRPHGWRLFYSCLTVSYDEYKTVLLSHLLTILQCRVSSVVLPRQRHFVVFIKNANIHDAHERLYLPHNTWHTSVAANLYTHRLCVSTHDREAALPGNAPHSPNLQEVKYRALNEQVIRVF